MNSSVGRYVLASAILGWSAGCIFVPDDSAEPERTAIPRDVTSAGEWIASYERALDESDFEAYVALLEAPSRNVPGFRFVPIVEEDLPWVVDSYSTYDVEREIIATIMCARPQDEGVDRRVALEADLVLVEARPHTPGGEDPLGDGVVATTDASMRLLVSSEEIRSAETRLEFLLVSDARGFLRARVMRELDVGQPELETWSEIKSEALRLVNCGDGVHARGR